MLELRDAARKQIQLKHFADGDLGAKLSVTGQFFEKKGYFYVIWITFGLHRAN